MPFVDSDALKAELAKLPDLFNSSHFDALETAVAALVGVHAEPEATAPEAVDDAEEDDQ